MCSRFRADALEKGMKGKGRAKRLFDIAISDNQSMLRERGLIFDIRAREKE